MRKCHPRWDWLYVSQKIVQANSRLLFKTNTHHSIYTIVHAVRGVMCVCACASMCVISNCRTQCHTRDHHPLRRHMTAICIFQRNVQVIPTSCAHCPSESLNLTPFEEHILFDAHNLSERFTNVFRNSRSFFFLSLVLKTQPNHWTKRKVNTRLTT